MKVTIVEFVNEKCWLYIPLKKISRFQCVAKKNIPAQGKIPLPPAYLMIASLSPSCHLEYVVCSSTNIATESSDCGTVRTSQGTFITVKARLAYCTAVS